MQEYIYSVNIEIQEYIVTSKCGQEFIVQRRIQKDNDLLWCVLSIGNMCLNDKLEWEFEPLPSSRSDKYLKRTRFKFDEAIDLIKRYVNEK